MTFVSDVARNIGDGPGEPSQQGPQRWCPLFMQLRRTATAKVGRCISGMRDPLSTVGDGSEGVGRAVPTFLLGEELEWVERRER